MLSRMKVKVIILDKLCTFETVILFEAKPGSGMGHRSKHWDKFS
jgi:hypothetical protein